MMHWRNPGFYDRFQTSWVCLDAELMPWSAKAQSLLETQYGSVGAAATQGLNGAVEALVKAAVTNEAALPLLEKYQLKKDQTAQFIDAYRRYCWPVHKLTDYKLAPFHILATEGKTWVDQSHEWHMEDIQQICEADSSLLLLRRTRSLI